MQNWPCIKKLIQTIIATFLIFNQLQAAGSIIQRSSHQANICPNPVLIYFTLHSVSSSEIQDHRRKSHILSQSMNASLVVSCTLPVSLSVSVWVWWLAPGIGPGAIVHTDTCTQVHSSIKWRTGPGCNVMPAALSTCVQEQNQLYDTTLQQLHYTANDRCQSHTRSEVSFIGQWVSHTCHTCHMNTYAAQD